VRFCVAQLDFGFPVIVLGQAQLGLAICTGTLMQSTISSHDVPVLFNVSFRQLRGFQLRRQSQERLGNLSILVCRRGTASFEHATELDELFLQGIVMRHNVSIHVIAPPGKVVGIAGTILLQKAIVMGFVALLMIPLTACLQIVCVLLMVRHGHVLLCEFDLQPLTHNMLASECLIGTMFHQLDQGLFLLKLGNSSIALCQSCLVRTGLGYQHGAIPGYQMLLLLQHDGGLLSAFF
jgi:hypothetical protein